MATALTHARLFEREREMVQRLKELDQAKSDFVASVSHELRTPLTSIRGYVEMLLDGDVGALDSEQLRMLEVVQRNADRLLAVIEDLLTLSRIESGAFRVARAPVAIDDVARAAIGELQLQASRHAVELVADVAHDVPPVLGDSSQLERVLFNLLANAIKFTTDGGRVVVRVRTSGATVEVDVEDEGIGIPEAELERLFTRFFRSSTSQERAIQGTGLGLVIVKSIVEHHGGEIAVRSQPNVGTTVTVRLPVAATPVGVTRARSAPGRSSSSRTTTTSAACCATAWPAGSRTWPRRPAARPPSSWPPPVHPRWSCSTTSWTYRKPATAVGSHRP